MTVSKEDLFTGKVQEYEKLRPHYPKPLFDVFNMHVPLVSLSIADVGAGTGYVSIPLLNNGHIIEAIEPNDDMRLRLGLKIDDDKYNIRSANAQATTLENRSVDGITMGNVAHWLDGNSERLKAILIEFKRVLKDNGFLAVFSLSPSLRNRWLSDIFNLAKKYDPTFDIEKIERTFSDHGFHAHNFIQKPNESGYVTFSQSMSKEDFYEFILSHSFCDDRMEEEINMIFDKYQANRSIEVEFSSSIYIGQLKPV
jgi:ubiquinone/menaquinone biosynthesis C-methylase UbiE